MKIFKEALSKGRDKLRSGTNINPSTLTGAIDVIAIEHPDGTFKCGPFYVRFGKIGTLKPTNKIVDININGIDLEHLHMRLDNAGKAYFADLNNKTCFDVYDNISTSQSSVESSQNIRGTCDKCCSHNNESLSQEFDITKKMHLTSEEIISLNLSPGKNNITFSVTTKYQGTTKVFSIIYLWKWYDKIVISDIDGTITKSDVLGQVLPILGRDWIHLNVVTLYNKIHQNNYKFLYLSARAIGQSARTRTFLQDVIKNSSEKLPDGPILLSSKSLFRSLYSEIIEKTPEVFKIQCLTDLRSLFLDNSEPFFAGFGNRVNDIITYRAVGINERLIFTVNPTGSLKNEHDQKWSMTYGDLSDDVNNFFLPIPNN